MVLVLVFKVFHGFLVVLDDFRWFLKFFGGVFDGFLPFFTVFDDF